MPERLMPYTIRVYAPPFRHAFHALAAAEAVHADDYVTLPSVTTRFFAMSLLIATYCRHTPPYFAAFVAATLRYHWLRAAPLPIRRHAMRCQHYNIAILRCHAAAEDISPLFTPPSFTLPSRDADAAERCPPTLLRHDDDAVITSRHAVISCRAACLFSRFRFA